MFVVLPSIKFSWQGSRQKTLFRSFLRLFVRRENFSSAQFVFNDAKNLAKTNLSRRDRFRQKIVEIGAILAIFKPFEVWKFACHFLVNLANPPRMFANLLTIHAKSGDDWLNSLKSGFSIFVDFLSENKGFGSPRQRPDLAKIDLKTDRLKCWKMYRSSCLVKVSTCRSRGLARGAGGPT